MADKTNIEWTDATWPIVQGCDYESPGCTRCYAVRVIWRLMHNPIEKISGPLKGLVRKDNKGNLLWTGKVALRYDRLKQPRSWRNPRRIFIPSHGDLFHPAVPDTFIHRVFDEIEYLERHTFQVLTKRSERMREHMLARYGAEGCDVPPNLWLGVSVENKNTLHRIEELRRTAAAVRFLSAEPLLEDLGEIDLSGIDWVICGGESGPGKRPTDIAWHRSLRDQCKAHGVSFFEKQIDKVQPIPDDLMVREMPDAT